MALQHLPTLPVPAMLGHILTLHRLGWHKLVLHYMNAYSITDAYNYIHERQHMDGYLARESSALVYFALMASNLLYLLIRLIFNNYRCTIAT